MSGLDELEDEVERLQAEIERLRALLDAADNRLRGLGISIHDDMRQKIHSALSGTH